MSWEEKSFDFASDLVKQLITLATAVVAVMITFVTDVLKGAGPMWLVILSWVFFLVSIPMGVLTLMALTGSMTTPKRGDAKPSIWEGNTRFLASAQVFFFSVAMALLITFGAMALYSDGAQPTVAPASGSRTPSPT
jgi:hypothetical protein